MSVLPGTRNRVEGGEVPGCGRPGFFQLAQGIVLGCLDSLGTVNKFLGEGAQPLRRCPVKDSPVRRRPGGGSCLCSTQTGFHVIEQRTPGAV